jgi:pyrroloquinoline quinone biosynthesis protein B
MKVIPLLVAIALLGSCNQESNSNLSSKKISAVPLTETSLVILGTLQDAGSPHIACTKDCCKELFQNPDQNRKVVSLGVIDPENKVSYLFEATPDISVQMKMLKQFGSKETPDGIFLTHAHIGHYSGLMYLGKEAMNAKSIPVFAMPRMKKFLEESAPWSQLVSTSNISIRELAIGKSEQLTLNITVTPFTVPHRDEYSETVGFIIEGPTKKALFIPDIDKWEKWDTSIIEEIKKVDYAFIDATFFDAEEIDNRDIREIPHPFIIESMELFANLSSTEKKKIYFIHVNHTNPVLNSDSKQAKQVIDNGFNLAQIYDVFRL